MNDIMVDLETMDNVRTSTIVAVGAVHCDLITGEIKDTFYRTVNLEGQQEIGLSIDPSTIYWWMAQNDGARSKLLEENKTALIDMCNHFSKWLKSCGNEKLRIWGNGASFDNAIIRHAFKACNIEFPVPFWQDRDMRTILGFYPKKLQEDYRKNNFRTGTYHNALDDCKHQIKYCSHILRELGVKELY